MRRIEARRPRRWRSSRAENAWVTLMNGFTTVQSVGAASDKELRDAIARGVLPGPRILTSLGSMNERTGTPDELREYVRKQKAAGADLIKIFASKSIREGGAQTMTDAQLAAACGEAKTQGLRTLVHAHARRRGAGGGEGRLLAGRARRVRQRRRAEVHGRARRLLRSQHRPRAAELHREQGEVPGHRQLQRGGLRLHGEGGARPTTRCSSARWRPR